VSSPSDNAAPALPLACALTAGEQRLRRAWIDELRESLLSRTATADGAMLRFRSDRETERQLRALVAAEAHCCPFLEFDLATTDEALELTVRGPPEARAIVDMFWDSRVK
jgi:hypothetical protein